MKMSRLCVLVRHLTVATAFAAIAFSPLCRAELARGQRGMAATVHPLATHAAIQAFQAGGNAVDAAVAAALTLGVVDGQNSGIGGGCLMLIRLANGRCVAIDGRETAPLAATRDMYLRQGKPDPKLSQTGALAAGVPGALMAYDHALRNFGRLTLRDLLLPAARIAEDGFVINAGYAQRMKDEARDLNQFEASRAIYLHPDGSPRTAGEILKQPDLATTYRALATNGIGWFYDGPFARATGDWMARNGGVLTAADFALYRIRLREPLVSAYRGFTIIGFPPPSSGGVHVAQILNILEGFDLKKLEPNSADLIHVTAEAMKLAFADRAYWLGDPDWTKVPVGLTAKGYAAKLRERIRLRQATPVTEHGRPEDASENFFGKHTTHFSTADAAGHWVACTATVNTSFGCKVVVPGTGVVLNNQMDDFAVQPGVTNYFGLMGAEANAVAPRRRPLSSMSPTIVLRGKQPVLAVGAAGGPTIISQTLLTLIRVLDVGMDLETALAQPRFHHQWKPDELKIERGAGEALMRELEQRGHKVVPVKSIGATQAVGVAAQGRGFVGAHDPRLAGKAEGW